MRPVLSLILLAAASGTAVASGEIQVGLFTVMIDNGHRSDCIETASGLCLAGMQGDGIGELYIDASQRFRRVGVIADPESVDPRLALLPDGGLVMDGSDFALDNPIFVLYHENIGILRGPDPLSPLAFTIDEEGVWVWIPWTDPMAGDPHLGFERRGMAHGNGTGVQYDRIGPFNDLPVKTASDYQVANWLACDPYLPCLPAQAPIVKAYQDATPNIWTDLRFDEVGAGSNRSIFKEDAATPKGGSSHYGGRSPSFPDEADPRKATPFGMLWGEPGITERDILQDEPLPRTDPSTPKPPIRQADPDASEPNASSLLATAAAAFVLAVILAALSSRFRSREDALQHEGRQRILKLVEERGPQSVSQIARAMGHDRTTILYHARILARTGAAELRPHGRALLVSLPRQALPSADPLGGMRAARDLVAHIERAGGRVLRARLHELAAHIPQRSRNAALRELAARGVIACRLEDGAEIVALATDARASREGPSAA